MSTRFFPFTAAVVEFVLFDQPCPCPYLPDRMARTPLRLPQMLAPDRLDRLLAEGDRRTGGFLYRTACEGCHACEPIRLDVERFHPNESQRRAQRKGDAALRMEIASPSCDAERLALFNRHRRERGLANGEDDETPTGYREFLVETCAPTIEFSYWRGDVLVAVSIADRGKQSLNAVYTYFDPTFRGFGLGTYAILNQIATCRRWSLKRLYLGFYVADNAHMKYKSAFHPHERLVDGEWREFA